MPSSTPTTIDVRSLIDRPGATRSLDRRMPVPEDLGDDLVALGPDVAVDAIIESVVDGLLVRGTVTGAARVSCARCLEGRDDEVRADVVELFSTAPSEDEPGYAIVDATIDLDALLRDALSAALPVRPLCRPDCRGLCPTCGANRNGVPADSRPHDGSARTRRAPATACAGHDEPPDPRWAALSDLQLPDVD